MAVHLYQGGLGLPDRDFYFNKEEGVVRIRKEYVTHITNMLKLLGSEGWLDERRELLRRGLLSDVHIW